jgi:hypothetical protein
LPQFKKAEAPFEKARAVTTRLMRSMLGVISPKTLKRNRNEKRASYLLLRKEDVGG